MKELVVISGKGGTGKTSLTASFAMLEKANMVVADCDVDAADLHLLLNPQDGESHDFYSGKLAVMDRNKCSDCGYCAETCRFDAIHFVNGEYQIEELSCEGCGYCSLVCPEGAITMEEQNVGKWQIARSKSGNIMVYAALNIGAENSGKLVAKVKNEAKKIAKENNIDTILIDGSPGVGCPVISSLSGADFVILVTEPTLSGLEDLKRVYSLVKQFKIRAGCIINKYDLNKDISDRILSFLDKEKIFHLASIPYDEAFIKALTMGQTIVEYEDKNLDQTIRKTWREIKQIIKNEIV